MLATCSHALGPVKEIDPGGGRLDNSLALEGLFH